VSKPGSFLASAEAAQNCREPTRVVVYSIRGLKIFPPCGWLVI
jgi:hypothetical protein